VRDFEGYMDGFRWTLATRYPNRVRRSNVVLTTLILALSEFSLFMLRRRKNGLQAALGHFDFIKRLINRENVQQFVEHRGSGPFV
jgi:hypothetical protein